MTRFKTRNANEEQLTSIPILEVKEFKTAKTFVEIRTDNTTQVII